MLQLNVNISWSHEGSFLSFLYFSDCGAEKWHFDINKVLTAVSLLLQGLMALLDRRFWIVLLPRTIYMYSVWTRGSSTATLRPMALLLFVFCCAEWTQSNTDPLDQSRTWLHQRSYKSTFHFQRCLWAASCCEAWSGPSVASAAGSAAVMIHSISFIAVTVTHPCVGEPLPCHQDSDSKQWNITFDNFNSTLTHKVLCNGPLCGHAPQWVISLQVFPFSQRHNTWCDQRPVSESLLLTRKAVNLKAQDVNEHFQGGACAVCWCVCVLHLCSLHTDSETLG